ncbi:hypothetical protein F66182_16409, partial [Fusarium sp. NRRL 66182]
MPEASFVASRPWPRLWPRPRPRWEPRPGPPRPRPRNREFPLVLLSELATTGVTTAASAALMLVWEALVTDRLSKRRDGWDARGLADQLGGGGGKWGAVPFLLSKSGLA